MNWREQAIRDIKLDEGCSLVSYRDQCGVWTIGWGHTGPEVGEGTTCTDWQAEFWLSADISEAELELGAHAPWWSEAPAPVRRGLLNMCFNLGWPRLAGFKKMLVAGASSSWGLMADEALASRWAEQVGQRANRIAELFRSAAPASTVDRTGAV